MILIYGIPAGESERYTEDLLSSRCKTDDDVKKVMDAASKDGWHSFRTVTVPDDPLDDKPDFRNVLN